MTEEVQMIIDETKSSNEKTIQHLIDELEKVRAGRATPSMLSSVVVEYYENLTPLSQVANVSTLDARTLTVTPWEKEMVPIVEKVILTSDLGLTPASAGAVIRVPIPAMTEERRKDLVRVVRNEAEESRIAVRSIRRDVLGDIKELLNDKLITKDDDHRVRDEIQKITNRYVDNINNLLKDKEAEIMEV